MNEFRLRNSHKAKAFSHAATLLEERRNADLHARQADLCKGVAADAAALVREAVDPVAADAMGREGLRGRTREIGCGPYAATLFGRWTFGAPWAVARDRVAAASPHGPLDLGRPSGTDRLALPYEVETYDALGPGRLGRDYFPRGSLDAVLRLEPRSERARLASEGIAAALRELDALSLRALSRLADAADLFRAFDACQTSADLRALYPASETLLGEAPGRTEPTPGAARALLEIA